MTAKVCTQQEIEAIMRRLDLLKGQFAQIQRQMEDQDVAAIEVEGASYLDGRRRGFDALVQFALNANRALQGSLHDRLRIDSENETPAPAES